MGCFSSKNSQAVSHEEAEPLPSEEERFVPITHRISDEIIIDVKPNQDIMQVFSETYFLASYILGEGSNRIVRKCMLNETGEEFAVKIVEITSSYVETRFLQEVEVLRAIDHPMIPRLHMVYKSCKTGLMVTELCTGRELSFEM